MFWWLVGCKLQLPIYLYIHASIYTRLLATLVQLGIYVSRKCSFCSGYLSDIQYVHHPEVQLWGGWGVSFLVQLGWCYHPIFLDFLVQPVQNGTAKSSPGHAGGDCLHPMASGIIL